MPLASLSALIYYGPAAGAVVVNAGGNVELARITGVARAGASVSGAASVPLAKATRLVNRPAFVQGSGAVTRALPKALARAGAVVRIGTLSQDDVTGAVLEAPVQGETTLKQALQQLLASSGGGGGGAGGPSAVEIAAAVVAALQATSIPVDTRRMNGADIVGDGSAASPWRGAGVSP